jgi:hypothetical protein
VSAQKLNHGHLVGVKSNETHNFEPWLVVDTGHGFKFVRASDVGIRPTHEGPHIVFPSVVLWAEKHGEDAETFTAIFSWEDCLTSEDAYDVVYEAERILSDSIDPAYEISTWLRTNKLWAGSSASMIKGPDGRIAGAFVNLHTSNPYMLRALLKWLRTPNELIVKATGIER